jgi:hypothetical protein
MMYSEKGLIMYYERKTRDRNAFQFLWIPLLVVVTFIGLTATVGVFVAFYILGAIFFAASFFPLITYWRTRNAGFLAVGLYQFLAAMLCVSAPAAIHNKPEIGLLPLFLVGMYVSGIVAAYLFFNRKLKWRGQEILEMAGMQVEETGDSFTARPRPAGKVPISKTEMIRFVDFITSNLIAFPITEENRVVFVLALPSNNLRYVLGYNNLGHILGVKKDYLDDTWVAIDFDGNISVHIAQDDYLLFKQDLAFDQLCQALGNVFADFLELSQNGQQQTIIDRMNALRLSPFV